MKLRQTQRSQGRRRIAIASAAAASLAVGVGVPLAVAAGASTAARTPTTAAREQVVAQPAAAQPAGADSRELQLGTRLGWKGPGTGAAKGLGPREGLLSRDKLVLRSAINVDLTHHTVRLPVYRGESRGQTVWYVLLDASDQGLAEDLGVNYAPKLANIGIGNPAAVQTVTLDNPKPEDNRFGPAVLHFPGAPDFSPTRIATPGPKGFPLAKLQPGAVAKNGYSPFIRIAGSSTVYDAPIIATGDGPFDVIHHTNTADRVIGGHVAPKVSPPGQFLESYVDLLFVKGFDAGQPIVYLSTEAGQPLTSVLERATYVPALDSAAFNGGDDFIGSARERLFGFVNGQTGANNPQAQGFVHLVKDGHASEDANYRNTALIDALRNGGDLLNVFGDFPTLNEPRHASAYSPLWDAQLGEWTAKAIRLGYDKRQIDEVEVFNLAATRPDLLTGPAGAPYGSVGVDIVCAVVAYIDKAPTANLADPVANSQFPPR